MRVACFHALREIAPFREQINALNLASATPDPFSTFDFYANLVSSGRLTTNDGVRLWFLAAFEADRLIGYMALKEKRRTKLLGTVVTLCFLTEHDADRPHVVAIASDVAAVTEAFYAYLDGRKEWHFLELQQQDEQSSLYPLPPGVKLRRCWVKSWPNMDNYTIHFRWRTFREYFQSMPKKVRANIRRDVKKLCAAGNLELLISDDPNSTPALLDLYCSIEAHSWKSQAKLSVSGDPVRKRSVRGLLDPHHPLRIVVLILLLDGIPIGGLIAGAFTAPAWKGLYALYIVFDDRCTVAGPGSAILLLTSRFGIERGYTFCNLLSGFGHYKTRWQATLVPSRSAQIYRFGGIPFWHRLLGETLRWMKNRLPERLRSAKGESADLYNPMRRELLGVEATSRISVSASSAERMRYADLVAKARTGQCESLSSAELVAVLLDTVTPTSGTSDADEVASDDASSQQSRPERSANQVQVDTFRQKYRNTATAEFFVPRAARNQNR